MPPAVGRAPRGSFYLTLLLALALAIAALSVWRALRPEAPPLVGGPFALEAGGGRVVTDKDLIGHPFLVYFGYTHCPDVCPTELAAISTVFAKLPDKPVTALFITVDPERDTPDVMADYVSSFDKRILGLSGSREALNAVAKAYRVYARKGDPKPDGAYTVDHTSVVYLMDSKGRFVEGFNLDRPPGEAAKELAGYL